jgi:hypothetical protein
MWKLGLRPRHSFSGIFVSNFRHFVFAVCFLAYLWTKSFSLLISCFLHALQRNFDLFIPRKGTARPQSQFPHSCVCERFIYTPTIGTPIFLQQNTQTYQGNIYINRTQKHECRNWDYGRAVPFLGIYVSNFR